jgi:hypothetical protein
MTSSILTFCFQYQHARKLVNRHKASGYLLEIRYEDLVDHSEKEIKRILRFIGVENTQNSNKKEYYSKIPQHQRYLHENISQGLLPERKDAWKDELKTCEIFFLEKALKREMKKAGYLPVNPDFRAVKRKWFVVYQLMIFYIKQGLKAYFPDFYDHLKRLSLKGIFLA